MANLIVMVVNNGLYGTIRMHQERRYPGRVIATNIVNPDFVSLAQSQGAFAERVETTAAFPEAFRRAETSGRPAMLELMTDPVQSTPTFRLPV
jgi:acetolactate synthase-1/2/3 large subunit